MNENPPVTSCRAIDLALLVELEARWENLRPDRSAPTDLHSTHKDLTRVQQAYEAFRIKLAEYNKKYTSDYVAAAQQQTSVRLALWLRKMRDVYHQVEGHADVPVPSALLEKAYRCADAVARKAGKEPFGRSGPSTVAAAVQELQALEVWCNRLAPQTAE